ncbi:putative mitochondrial hypothetical protein [Leptomonas pyrrhocoris]|uniref:Uncharacterized protein n=1 Tax=Leptomonas pyrrhocoris TaxID=157538 RepID=A0A0N0VHD7_LEPPY|nr:putative mitochondrial hypothetical protein [Leptomonas pyrrhocoris]KPA85481.1 putative mitochondrial hypothetical protein [Leptomonas pyrrhocoris]|eukprot:XP_015663920.1 putative mitochondrial hypothetical protein [Leptomonas pyrrhocoris]
MEPRRWRPKFYNPFTERKKRLGYLPLYRGFFRTMPLHRWSMNDIQKVLGYAALNPSLFGFPDQPTCIVNTAYFLPSLRSRLRGVWAFGTERGCKNIIVPHSCSNENFDVLDARLIEPLFRWNPGVQYVYLSRHCQPMAQQLLSSLSKCPHLREVTLEGWNDAVAVHRVMAACKQADVLETYSLDDPPRDWRNELSVQALTTLIEMHPKLRAVKSHRLYLTDWYEATRFSRCKHNVALVPFSCDFVILFYGMFLLLVCVPAYGAYRLVYALARDRLSVAYAWFWSVMAFIATFAAIVVFDTIGWSYRGRGWVYMQKYFILAKRRVDIWMNVHQSALVPK